MKTLISSPSQLRPHFHPKTLTTLSPKATSQKSTPKNPAEKSPPKTLTANPKGFTGKSRSSARDEFPPAKFMIAEEDLAGDEEKLPEVVVERLIARILVCVGVPMASGLAALKIFGEAKQRNIEIPIWVQLVTMLFTFGLSSVGLAYGALSSSWDAEKKGSLLGFEEAQQNWVDMWREEDEYNRNKTNNNKEQ